MMSKSRLFATAALALTGALGLGAAQAHEADVRWSITIGSPVQYQAVPTYVRPAPVVVYPAPAYPVYQRSYQQPTRWDRDGDGIPNRYDHLYNPAWDRDGDGIPNRHDRFDNRRFDRDGDGIPNRYDRH
jgi:hypothetical protein